MLGFLAAPSEIPSVHGFSTLWEVLLDVLQMTLVFALGFRTAGLPPSSPPSGLGAAIEEAI